MSAHPIRNAGFTLIEVIGAFFMTTVVLFMVMGIFSENGRQRSVATEKIRVATTAAAALDVIAQDLEAALFVQKPEGLDPNRHAWLFRAEGVGELGSTRLHFQTQNVARDNLGEHASTWVDVAYFLTEEEDVEAQESGFFASSRYTLWRWRSSRPPSDAARRFPDQDEPGAARVAEGLASFGVTFVDLDGATLEEWDSTYGTGENPIPVAAEIRLSLFQDARPGEADPGVLQIPGRVHERSVSVAMHRPVDVDALIATATNADGPGCATISDCADFDDQWFVDQREAGCDGDDELCDLLNSSTESCWSEVVSGWPSVANLASPQCEEL